MAGLCGVTILRDLEAEVQRLRKVLAVYADRGHWVEGSIRWEWYDDDAYPWEIALGALENEAAQKEN